MANAGAATWNLPLLINNLEAKVNSGGGGGGGGVTNPLTQNLLAAGYNVTGVGQLAADSAAISLGPTDTFTVADQIGNTWARVDVGGNVQLGTAGGLGTVRAPTVTPATDSSTKVATTAFVQAAAAGGGTTTQVASPVVLTAASTSNQLLTGSLAYVVTLPDATTLPVGRTYYINVNTNAVAYTCTINGFTGVNIVSNAQQGSILEIILLTNATSAGTWDSHGLLPNQANFGTSGLVYQGNLTLTGSGAKTIGTSGTGNLTVQAATGALTCNSQGGTLALQTAGVTRLSIDALGATFGQTSNGPVRIYTGTVAPNQGTLVVGSPGCAPIFGGNTVIGLDAAVGLTTGGANTCIGNGTGYDLVTGSNNTYVGYSATTYGANTQENTFVGSNAGVGTTGNANTALGFQAGLQTTSGTGNVTLGHNTQAAPGITDCILLGRAASTLAGGGRTNEITIGALATGNGSNTITLGNSSATTLFTTPTIRPITGTALTLGSATTTTLTVPPTIRQVTGTSLTLGDATTTGGIIVPAAATAGIICNSLSSNAATKLVLNSTETTNGIIELQKSAVKTGAIQYANATFPVQLSSQAGLSLDAGTSANTHISAGGASAGNVINLITGGTLRSQVTDTGLIGVKRPGVAGFGVGATSYTPPAGAVWIKVRVWGGGGSGSWATNQRNSGGAGPFSGTAGGNTTFVNNGITYLLAAGGGGAGAPPYVQQGGVPGGNVGNASIDFISIPGGYGMGGFQQQTGIFGFAGGMGGLSPGGTPSVLANPNSFAGGGYSSPATYGAGGAGGNIAVSAGGGNWSGAGGAGGGCLEGWIPVSLLSGASTVTVGAGGAYVPGATTPANSLIGTSGGDGACIIEAYY